MTNTRSEQPAGRDLEHEPTTPRRLDPRLSPAPTAVENPLVDVRDMIVVHTAMLREFRLAPRAVARVPTGAHRAARRVDAHLQLMCDLLHHHHTGEDELLWPPLRALLTADDLARLKEAQAQHTDIDRALERVGRARQRWTTDVDDASRDFLITALDELLGLLVTHLDTEERELLPLAAAHLTPAQWAAVGAAGAASVPKSKMLLVFGMFAYEGDPDVLRTMLESAPPPARGIVPLLAPRIYARYARRLHGTPRP